MYKISVIMPVYNCANFLEKGIDSVLSQSLNDVEVICINDGSEDNSLQVLQRYQKHYRNVKVLNQENHGAAYSRNVGIQNADGEYVFFLDSDDWIPDSKVLEHLYVYAKKNNLLICGGSLCRSNADGYHRDFNETQKGYVFKEEAIYSYNEYQFDLGFSRFLYKRSMLIEKQIYFPEYKNFEDPVFFVRAMTEAEVFGAIPEDVYVYRESDNGASHPKKLQGILDMVNGMWDNLRFAEEHNLKELYALTYRRLNRESLCEIENTLNYIDQEKKLFNLLIQVNAAINWDLLPSEEEHLLNALNMIYLEYRKYEKIRNGKIVRCIRGTMSSLKKFRKR